MTRTIVNISVGERYLPLGSRLARSAAQANEHLVQWHGEYPAASPRGFELPYLAYAAKPFGMLEASAVKGFECLLWLDSACVVLEPLDPLWEQIERDGHYTQENGFSVGQWCSDAALGPLGITREESFTIPEISTCALGLDMRREDCQSFVNDWCRLAADGVTIPGAHTNDIGGASGLGIAYRNVGHVSDDPRVMGHRHDQTAASVLAWRRSWKMTPRPIFVDYDPVHDERTLIVNRG